MKTYRFDEIKHLLDVEEDALCIKPDIIIFLVKDKYIMDTFYTEDEPSLQIDFFYTKEISKALYACTTKNSDHLITDQSKFVLFKIFEMNENELK